MADLRSLEIFFWVARLRSFRGAADRLNTTQPAVSQRIAALEAELGVRLLERGGRTTPAGTGRGVVTTAQGRRLLDYAERMLRLRTEMLEAVAGPGAVGGVLRLGVAETIVHTWLARFIERAHALYPAVTLDIEVDVTHALRGALASHAIDLAFLMGPLVEAEMANLPLCRYPLAFAASPKLGLPAEPLDRDAVLALPIITYPRSTAPTIALSAALRSADGPAPRVFGNASLATIVRMTLDGIGLSVIPPAVVARELAEGTLRLVETTLAPPELAFTASWPSGPDDALARRLAELAVEVATEAGHR
ncbi:LysR family transcriptional regulator [Falsiroseomonas sp.]|uniref:LysR family transcriptional regulator n=1 Tax=Falsiroseomonas sp. TaxID=2870721 RepID=UPI003F6F9238